MGEAHLSSYITVRSVKMVRAKLISSDGPYLQARIEVDGVVFTVMDEFGVCAKTVPEVGEEFDYEFSAELLEDEEWERIFSGNPDGKVGLEPLGGWRYKAYGKVVGINPVVVDCGLLQIEDVVSSHDPALIGEKVAFTISRLGGYAYK